MEVRSIIIPYTRGEIFKGHPIGDEHTGTRYCAEGVLRAKHKEIRNDPYSFWWGMGDKCEFITPSDKRYEYKALSEWIEDTDDIAREQVDHYCELVKPSVTAKIRDTKTSKCLGLIWGNHEWVIKKHYHTNVQRQICKELKTDDLGYTCIYHIIFRRENSNESHMFKGVFTHGKSSARTRGGKLTVLRNFMNRFQDMDFFCYAHMHDIITETKPVLTTDARLRVREAEACGAVTGCYFKTYTQGVEPSYGEMMGYDPTPIGSPVFLFNPDKGEVTVSKGSRSKMGLI